VKLTEHFTLDEFLVSETAARLGIDNSPPNNVFLNLTETARRMEKVRELLGVPIRITSGYRCPALNKAIGGAAESFHMLGLAVDFIAPTFGTPLDICLKIAASGIKYDQLIHEFGRNGWVHIGFEAGANTWRMQQLTATRGPTGKTVYQPGIVYV
jgi:hypothetical protein